MMHANDIRMVKKIMILMWYDVCGLFYYGEKFIILI